MSTLRWVTKLPVRLEYVVSDINALFSEKIRKMDVKSFDITYTSWDENSQPTSAEIKVSANL